MSVKPISPIKTESSPKPFKNKGKDYCPDKNEKSAGFMPSFYGDSKIYSDNIKALKKDMGIYPGDIEYRKDLMANAGKSPEDYYKIRAIIGVDEIKAVMKDFNENEQAYSVGINDSNINNKTIRANLHIHTLASDGFFTTQELLDKAARYADEVKKVHPEFKKEPFVIAITDHDTTESCKEAIEIISQDPLKYKNLRVVLGVEMTTYNNIATDIVKNPTNSHTLIYAIDPNEKTFSDFIENTKQGKHEIAKKIINQANVTYQKTFNTNKKLYSIKEAQNFFNPIKKGILGIYNYSTKYISTKAMLNEIVLKQEFFKENLKKNNLPATTDELLNEIQKFYYDIDKNNKPRSADEMITTFLSEKTGISKEKIQNVLKKEQKKLKFAEFEKNMASSLEPYKRTLSPKYNYMPSWETLYNATKSQPDIIIGIAHPLDATLKITEKTKKYDFLMEMYKEFKRTCKEKAVFSEVYYQSYKDSLQNLQADVSIKNLLNVCSKALNLFKTGSADSHRTNIFKRLY